MSVLAAAEPILMSAMSILVCDAQLLISTSRLFFLYAILQKHKKRGGRSFPFIDTIPLGE
ncbi:hypothetical protein [Labilibaculum sp.]|uniref:hypothetical protein n=1 Tax=Labilibaculum sp. TaxID=2060723 RepID=UPI0035632049